MKDEYTLTERVERYGHALFNVLQREDSISRYRTDVERRVLDAKIREIEKHTRTIMLELLEH